MHITLGLLTIHARQGMLSMHDDHAEASVEAAKLLVQRIQLYPVCLSCRTAALEPAAVGAIHLLLESATHLALSSDELALAAVNRDGVHIFSLPEVMQGSAAPVHSIPAAAEVKQLLWSPSAGSAADYILLTDEGLSYGSLGGSSTAVAADVTAASWSPDGSMFAYIMAGRHLAICQAGSYQQLQQVDINHPDGRCIT
jgi:hypothetical protein